MNLLPPRVVALLWSSLILLAAPSRAAVVTANFTSATTVPVTAASYTATGNTVNFTLSYAPTAGTSLTVVKNTGLAFISGAFSNLAQGQAVNLTYGGVTYPFVANYFGGTGNDLVLQWANSRLLSWGGNSDAQLGDLSETSRSVPGPVLMNGALAGKTVTAGATGYYHSLVLCSDGSLIAWGKNDEGQLGNNSTRNGYVPTPVDRTGVLAGKTVIAISSGSSSCLALCADGTLASWGDSLSGSLGDGSYANGARLTPVLVVRSGVLAGKAVVAIASGSAHCLALCADGTVASWGSNFNGQLGNNAFTDSNVPVLVDQSGVLAGKSVVAIAAGAQHSLALCSDGTLAAWGYSSYGQLGNGTSASESQVPVLVSKTGGLAGKTPVAIACGDTQSLALCSDGSIASWGHNNYGQLGTGDTTDSAVAVTVSRASALAGKTVTSIVGGNLFSLARCADGTLVSWGSNGSGELGNNANTGSLLPAAVSAGGQTAGEVMMAAYSGKYSSFSLGLAGSPPSALVMTLAATGITDSAAVLHGSANANGSTTTVIFEYGPTTAYGNTVAASPSTVTGVAATAVSATPGGLLPNTTYHFRIVATNSGGTVKGDDLTFTTTQFASLSGLTLSDGVLSPAFAASTTAYWATVANSTGSITVTPVALSNTSTLTVNGTAVASGAASGPINLAVGANAITLQVAAADGISTRSYAVTVNRLPVVYAFDSAATIPVTARDPVVGGSAINFALNYAPLPGATLTVIDNPGVGPIQGQFSNLTQGQLVNLTFGGVTYPFVANYYGGRGNDLVLLWANTRLLAWGANASGQVGNNSIINTTAPVPVITAGVLQGKTVIATAAGGDFSLVLCADGALAAWGSNSSGQLGNNSTSSSLVPVLVDRSGVLAGKTVVAIAVGSEHSLVLCSDGTLAAWGYNYAGQLGNNSTTNSSVPVLVNQSGVLAGRSVVAIAAGQGHCLALCADGTLVAWGSSSTLGNNGTALGLVPVLVDQSGVLAGRKIVSIAAGAGHSLALCSDGAFAAWGGNFYNQLGVGGASQVNVPLPAKAAAALAGKTVVGVAAGSDYSLALCSDGSIAGFGTNDNGQLGDGHTGSSYTWVSNPVAADLTGVMAGRTPVVVIAGNNHSLALCTDGSLAAWGDNSAGQFGNGTTIPSAVPVLSNAGGLASVRSGCASSHVLALMPLPPVPLATTLAASGRTLNGSVNAQGAATAASFEYGLTTTYGSSVAATPAAVTGATATAVNATPSGLLSGFTYHYRVVAASQGGSATGQDMTFTTDTSDCLSNLTPSRGAFAPAFERNLTSYSLAVPFDAATITLTPVVLTPGATVTVDGVPVDSGSASGPLNLTAGSKPFDVVVTPAGGGLTKTYTVTVTRLPAVLTFNSATDVPVTLGGFNGSGITATFALNFAPTSGTCLTAVRDTGANPIQGTFSNLAQWQQVNLTYGGISYPFVANYYGGSGNDLVLQWANKRLVAWGGNSSGALGNGSTIDNPTPLPVDTSGVLAGKLPVAVAGGNGYTLGLFADGSLAAWGSNTYGQLGNNSTASSLVPVAVDQTGVLAGRTVVAISAGAGYNLALCADGTLVAWGANASGQLGNGSTTNSPLPVLVNQAGVLAGRAVVAISAGGNFSLALCSDGTLAAWGSNANGRLGNNSTVNSSVPVLVTQSGVLTGKTAVAIAAGANHSLLLCSDGTVAAWGYNYYSQLGNGTGTDSSVPVWVAQAGGLAGKTVVGIAAGTAHSLVVCADGTLATWGSNSNGQLGDNDSYSSGIPVQVTPTGVLAGKTAVSVFAGDSHCLALCSDGTLAAWGDNHYGQLASSAVYSNYVPLLVNVSSMAAGERIVSVTGGLYHNLALVASPPPPQVTTLAATGVNDTIATLNGIVNAEGSTTTVSLEYGLTNTYGLIAAATPASVSGTAATAASVTLSGLLSATTYHYRMVATSAGGTIKGQDLTFTTTDLARLTSLSLSNGTLLPAFASICVNYAASVPNATASIRVTPVCAYPTAGVKVNGATVASGTASNPINLAIGNNVINIVVTSANGSATETYIVTVTRLPAVYQFNSAASVPVAVGDFSATGYTATFALGYAPTAGTDLTVIRNTGPRPIQGTFGNLAQGQPVSLSYGGITYSFVANYSGGTGNDLVLQWANARMLAWGRNSSGELGNNSTTSSNVPVAVDLSGVLAGKTVVSMAEGGSHSLVLCADGTLAAWGANSYGQLGNNSTTNSSVPVAVDLTGVLAARRVVAVAAGDTHSMALCADGTVVAWGNNLHGQLGNGSTTNSSLAVAVASTGVLADKAVLALAAGGSSNLALCSDGTLVAWGANTNGQLGNGSTSDSSVPVLVKSAAVLAAKRVAAIAVGTLHSLALCTDGTVAAWGFNNFGQLGNNTLTNSNLPVAVDLTGVLAARTVVAVAAGNYHSVALCSDGTVAAWGYNSNGQLGNGGSGMSRVPALVNQAGVLAGKTILTISSGVNHTLALCTDGTMAGWGTNSTGQLGNASTSDAYLPVSVTATALAAGERFVAAAGGSAQSLAMVAMPPPSLATTVAASAILDAGATLNGSVNAQGTTTTVTFDFGLTTSYGTTLAAAPASVAGTTTTATSAVVNGLFSGTTYHYRVVATGGGGTVKGADMTFTTTTLADLSSLSLSSGTLDPSFAGVNINYLATVPFSASSLTVTPVCVEPTSRVRVNGTAVASGAASGPINLAVGNNVVSTVVISNGGSNTKTYAVTVYRLPETFTYNSATDVPVAAGAFLATGVNASFTLNYAPLAGTNLMVVKNTGAGPIRGVFDNLANGQTVNLTFGGIKFAFVANYFGGSGNDLVLQWANTRLVDWGYNTDGELGNNSTTQSRVPVPVIMNGVLAGRTILSIAAGAYHSLALCSDGTVAAWGSNSYGQLGIGSSTTSKVPVWVNRTGALAGKTVVAIAAGGNVSEVLCADGTIAAWGDNSFGQLGNGGTIASNVPVLVNQAGVLAGKTVVGVATGGVHSLALCADGTVAAWGYNFNGQLGNATTVYNTTVPVMVTQTGALAGKTIIAIAAGGSHSLALCSDATLTAWGYNTYGQLGTNSTTDSNVPVLPIRTGVLAGKTVLAIAAGGGHSLALCSDGSMAAWGYNSSGQLGNNTTTNSSAPVLVTQTGVLAGKTVSMISAGNSHNLVVCADSTMATWGYNSSGQLGNNTASNSSVPVLVNPNGMGLGERCMAPSGGAGHSLSLVATPPPTLISGYVLADTNNDQVGDAPLAGVVLTLKDSNRNDIDSDPVATGVQPTVTTTAADGSYSFPNLSPGNYRVVETRPPGYLGVSDVDGGNLDVIGDVTPIVVLLSHNIANQNFVVVKAGSIGNLVWFDANRNGLVDPGEPGLPGVAVSLYKSTQTPGVDPPVATTVTDAGGIYNFTNIYPGDYVVYLPAPPYSAPSLSLVQDHNDDQIDNDNNGSQAVFGGPVSSPVVTISPGESDPTIDFGFTWYGPWQEWQHLNPLGGKNRPGDNPDGDSFDNLIEYAFDLSPGGGAGAPFSINPSTVSTGRVEFSFTRPAGATASVTYYLEYSSALGPATSWISIPLTTINPRNITITPLTAQLETVTIRNLEAREGFVRFRAELDANGDQITDHISYTGVQGWTESAMELGTRTYNNPYQHSAVFSGTVDATVGVSGQTLNFTTSAGTTDLGSLLTPGTAYYLEVTAGVNEGQRFDVVSATGSALTLASASDVCSDTPPFNTLGGALPATLAGNRVAIHRHWTLGELFPVTGFFAANTSTDADQVQTSAVAAAGTYWLYANGGSPKWVKVGDATLADQAGTAIAPGHGMFVTKRGIAAPLLACGEVRANNFIRPLCAGLNLVGGGYPVAQSATGSGSRQMDLADGFFGSTDPASADMFSLWKGDAIPGTTGYDNYYLYNPGTAPKWVKTGDATLAAHDAELLFLGDRSVLIQVKNDAPGYTIPNQSLVPSLIAAAQSATPMQDLTAGGSAQDPASALIAYAFGLDPAGNTAGQLPQAQLTGDSYVIEFTRPAGVTNITYGAEWSATLLPGSWTEIPDSGTGDGHIFSVPADQPRMFLRLKVSSQ